MCILRKQVSNTAGEKNFENRVKDYLKSKGIYPFGTPKDKMKVPICGYYEKRFANRMTKSGMPDMHIVIKGISLEVELKKVGGKPSELQIFNINLIRSSGSLGIILYPEDFENFKCLVNDILCKMPFEDLWHDQKQFDRG